MSVVGQAQGLNPYFLGTDQPVGVDATGTPWTISFQGRNAILTATFASGDTVQFTIPTDSTGGTKSGSTASFTIPNFGNAEWVTYAQHVKFEVRFPTPPKATTVNVNIARQNTTLVSDGNGGIDVLSGGVKVGALPQPFIDYVPDGATDTTRVWLNWVVNDPTMTLTMPSLSATEWATAVLDPTVITTSTASTATAYSNQRKLDRTQNGVLWAMYWDGTSNTTSSMHFSYSTDNGATWSDGGGFGFSGAATTYIPNGSLFIDLDDYAHVAYKDRSDGQIYYRRGTPNAGRTSWTWGAAVVVPPGAASTAFNYPDIVAHREGTGWKAHVVVSRSTSGQDDVIYYRKDISSGGVIGATEGAAAVGAASYGNANDKFPSIDFNHTGDGKTVAGGTPHLYVAWSSGATGAGKGIRFEKATYSASAWTWGTEVEIDSTSYANAGRISSTFDGTRVVIAYADSQSTGSIKIRERDAADTTTTTRTPTALSDGAVNGVTVGYDGASGNIYLGAIGATSGDPKYLTYKRSTSTWDAAWKALAATTAQADTLSIRRDGTGFVYTDGTASPYNVQFAAISLGITASLGVATETDSSLTPGRLKRLAIVPATTTDTAIQPGRVKTRSLGAAVEFDLAVDVSTGIRVSISPATETDAAIGGFTVTFTPVFYHFTPPTIFEAADDHFWGRYSIPVGQSVVKTNGVYKTTPYPWLGDIKHLKEGVDYFLGGRTYTVDNDVATALMGDGYTVVHV